ncbi:isopenicillin N synthase family oxygenase [Henriciella barbarensis]|uniref:2-oxoglutarate-dependent ethylene/succinate-forming enzyme n=1 Tax=Henriciella barbarensis TaxID=86342 RepID=A0A399R2C8_9PROT|nr:2-oxoglutarate and iron-dependent oxygenase domain-containing protein [Henriciella barbarensis]RIJ24684.1 isopenicillin N synthase family oxygenase [Henriciella barbarensis]
MSNLFEPIPYSLWREDKQAFAKRLGSSFRETGFAVITGHPVKQTVIDEANDAAKAFFALSSEAKEKYHDAEGGRQRGYTPFGTENAKGQKAADLKEFWHTGRKLPADSKYRSTMKDTPVVDEVPEFDAATYAFYTEMDEFGRDLLRAVALHLELPENWFDDKVESGNSILRLLHYPPHENPPPKGTVRAAAHEDINVITLLLGAEEAGLEVLHRSGDWLSVNPPAGSLVINCGDMLQRLTGGVLPSTTHRVVNPEPERAKFPRYSTPFFLHFNQDFLIEQLPQCLEEGGKTQAPITAQDYLMERLREIGLVKA